MAFGILDGRAHVALFRTDRTLAAWLCHRDGASLLAGRAGRDSFGLVHTVETTPALIDIAGIGSVVGVRP